MLESDALSQPTVAGNDGAPDDIAVAADIFGGGVNDEVGAELKGLLQIGSGEGVVDRDQDPFGMGTLSQSDDINQLQQGVGGGFKPEQLGLVADDLIEGIGLAQISVFEVNAMTAPDLVKEPEGATVHVLHGDDLVASVKGRNDGVGGGQSRGKAEPVLAELTSGEGFLEGVAGGVGGAGVFVAEVLARAGLGKSRGLVNGDDDRAGLFFRFLARVDGAGLEVMLFFHRIPVGKTSCWVTWCFGKSWSQRALNCKPRHLS